MRVNATTFQNAFGKYLKHVMNGEEIILTKNERGVAKLIAYQDPLTYVLKEGSAEYYIRKRVTYTEFLEITKNSDARYELIDGEIYLMASPTHLHQIAIREIMGQFYNYFDDKPCSPFNAPFDVRLKNDSPNFEDDPNVVQPDILVICDKETIDEQGRYHGVPSLVVEVLSPSTRSKDMIKKLSLYMLSGVLEYWIVDLDNQRIAIYELADQNIKCFSVVKIGEPIKSALYRDLIVHTDKMNTV